MQQYKNQMAIQHPPKHQLQYSQQMPAPTYGYAVKHRWQHPQQMPAPTYGCRQIRRNRVPVREIPGHSQSARNKNQQPKKQQISSPQETPGHPLSLGPPRKPKNFGPGLWVWNLPRDTSIREHGLGTTRLAVFGAGSYRCRW